MQAHQSLKAEVSAAPRWELSETGFNLLLASLASDRQKAAEKYLLLSTNLQRYFEVRGILKSQSAADEVVNRLARKLESGKTIENVNTYAIGIARMLTLELRRSPDQKTTNDLPEVSVFPSSVEQLDQREKLSCLDECLSKLTDDKRELITKYYDGERRVKIENRKKIAKKFGLPQSALRSRAVRLRAKLEACIKKCVKWGKN